MGKTIELEFLGTGTSTGVPQLLCTCSTCTSADPHDKRRRASVIVRYRGKRLLIDCGPDFREQMLSASDPRLDALLLTHIHYDHVSGIDDLRAYCMKGAFPIYAKQDVIDDLRARLPYCFAEHPYPGVPRLDLHRIDNKPFYIDDILIEPIPVMHYKLPILGFKIGPIAYITDCKTIDFSQITRLSGVPILVINSLREREHMSHLSLSEALEVIQLINPQHAYLTHMSHDMPRHKDVSKLLPPNVKMAYDGLIVSI